MLPYDEQGSGPVVVLLHAGVADRRMWAGHLQPLAAAGYRAVAMDLPGFGDASVAGGPQAPWADVLQTMDELAIERAVLVGNSFGGAVALRVAAIARDRVAALVLVSAPPPGMEPSAELEDAWREEEEALERGDLEAAVEAVVKAWTLPDSPEDLRRQLADMQRRALELQHAAGEVSEAPDPLEEQPEVLEQLQIPTLVIAGDRDKPDFRADTMIGVLPHAGSAVIEGAGHLAPLETPERFRELLLGFLREHVRAD